MANALPTQQHRNSMAIATRRIENAFHAPVKVALRTRIWHIGCLVSWLANSTEFQF